MLFRHLIEASSHMFQLMQFFFMSEVTYNRRNGSRMLAASHDISDPWRSKMVTPRRQNNRRIGSQLTRAIYGLSYARYLITKCGGKTGQRIEEKFSFSYLCNIVWSYRLFEAILCFSPILETQWPS